MAVNPIPAGYHTLTAQLSVDGAAEAIEFYKKAFGAEELDRAPDPSGKKVWHAALRIGDSMLFVNDVFPEMGAPDPARSAMWLYVADVDAAFARAVAAGGQPVMPPADMFWGDRMGQIKDPFGQKWTIAAHVKDQTPEETEKAMQDMLAKMHAPKA